MATLADYGPEVRAEVKQVREVVATLHEQLIKWNLVVWTAGNVSQRLHTADLMVIKPSGLRYEYLTPSSMVVCDLDGNVVDGAEAPSSDTASHAYIYRHMPDVYGVVHTHSTYATAWAATGQNIPCGLTMMGDEFGGPVPVGPFRLIGSEAIGEGVVETLKKYPKSPAVLYAEPWSVHHRQGRGSRRQGRRHDRRGGAHHVGRQAARRHHPDLPGRHR